MKIDRGAAGQQHGTQLAHLQAGFTYDLLTILGWDIQDQPQFRLLQITIYIKSYRIFF